MRRCALLVGFPLSLASCWLLSADLDVSGGEVPAGAGTDSSAPDAHTGDAGRWCDSFGRRPAFCADFDGDDPFAGWTVPSPTNGNAVDVTTGNFRSFPRALHAKLGPPGTVRTMGLRRDQPQASHVRLAYSLYIEERPTVGNYEVNIIRFAAPPLSYDFYLAITPESASYVEQRVGPDAGASVPIPLSEPIPTKTWTRVELDVDLGTKKLVVTIGGVLAASQDVTHALAAPIQLNAGITFAAAAVDQGSATIDDFAFDTL